MEGFTFTIPHRRVHSANYPDQSYSGCQARRLGKRQRCTLKVSSIDMHADAGTVAPYMGQTVLPLHGLRRQRVILLALTK